MLAAALDGVLPAAHGSLDVLDAGAPGYAARKATGGKPGITLASLATVAGFLALDLLVARSVARSYDWTADAASRKARAVPA